MDLVHAVRRQINRFRAPVHSARYRVAREFQNGEPEIRLLSVLADPDRDFLDVGANDGAYAFCALDHFRKVIAVEAHPGLIPWLRRIIGPGHDVLPVALSDAVGEMVLHIPTRRGRDVTTRSSLQSDANPGFSLRAVSVPVTTIDALGLDRLGVVKIDVEGHELTVLKGGAATLRACKPVCIVECEERHNAGGVARAFVFFEGLGYRAYFIHRGVLRDGAEFDVATLQRADDAKPVAGGRHPDYVNNFLFIHPDNATALEKIRQALR